jgi:hypothetical protein
VLLRGRWGLSLPGLPGSPALGTSGDTMTHPDPGSASPAGQRAWAAPNPPGFLESIQAAGSVAAPLLAGASFTLVALVLQSATLFARWQDVALLFFVAAGLAQVFAVQSVIWTRRYMATPDDLRQWYPEEFSRPDDRPTLWVRRVQWSSTQNARKWAERTRWCINVGISLLLAGIAVIVVPPGPINSGRWIVIVVASAGVAAEAIWVLASLAKASARRAVVAYSAVVIASGGATIAMGFAVSSDTGGGPATWWALALAVIAVPLWLAALADTRFTHRRLRRAVSARDRRTWLTAVLAMVAPALFVAALGWVIYLIAKNRPERHEDPAP